MTTAEAEELVTELVADIEQFKAGLNPGSAQAMTVTAGEYQRIRNALTMLNLARENVMPAGPRLRLMGVWIRPV